MKRVFWSITAITLLLAALALAVYAQTSLQISPDQSVGVLSEDPISGERWSTQVFPFGNYTATLSGEAVFCRTYLRFPLDGIPAGSTLQAATLYLYADDHWPNDNGAAMSVYQVTGDWPAGDAWNDMGNWPALGGAVATTDVSPTAGWFTWDVTALAQNWLDGAPNQGLALAAADPSSTASNWAAARRLTADDPGTRPYLAVTFLEPTPTPEPTSPPPTPAPTSPPPAPVATPVPVPTITPTPEPILLPETGGDISTILLIISGGLIALATLAGMTPGNKSTRVFEATKSRNYNPGHRDCPSKLDVQSEK